MSMAEKYPLTEKSVELREPTFARWQYTLSGWITLIRTQATDEGRQMERQICSRMWEDQEFNDKIRKEFKDWVAEDLSEDWRMEGIPPIKAARDEWAEMTESKLRKSMRKSVRYGGKYKGRGHGEKRRES